MRSTPSSARTSRPAWHRVLFAAAAAWLIAHELHAVLTPDLGLGPVFERTAHVVVLGIASLLCLARGRGAERVPWLLIGLGVTAWSFGEAYYTQVMWEDADPPIPSLADAGFLLFPPLTLAGLLLLLRQRARGVPRRRWIDGVTAALGVSALSAAIVFQTVLDSASGKPLGVATALAYPLWDLVLLGVIVGGLAGRGWRLDRTWLLLALGVSTFWLADSLYLVHTAQATYESGGWYDAGWWAGLLLIAGAAWQREPRAQDMRPADESLRVIAVPLAFGFVGLGLLVYGSIAHVNALAVTLAAASLLAVMGRATVTFRENVAMLRASREEALTDALTGLANRRALARELEDRLPQASPDRPLVLALFDLDGFKHYNDTFGHPAGDTLLVRLAGNLGSHLAGRGRAYRMGGDEFCALFEPGSEGPGPVVQGAAAALTEKGDGFSITCSHGAISMPVEAVEPAEGLRIADQRMYANKHAGRMSAGRQSRDVLMRALRERDPGAGASAEVVDLARATAESLGLNLDAVERVCHAAELRTSARSRSPTRFSPSPVR